MARSRPTNAREWYWELTPGANAISSLPSRPMEDSRGSRLRTAKCPSSRMRRGPIFSVTKTRKLWPASTRFSSARSLCRHLDLRSLPYARETPRHLALSETKSSAASSGASKVTQHPTLLRANHSPRQGHEGLVASPRARRRKSLSRGLSSGSWRWHGCRDDDASRPSRAAISALSLSVTVIGEFDRLSAAQTEPEKSLTIRQNFVSGFRAPVFRTVMGH
jgi:hypothetical protein